MPDILSRILEDQRLADNQDLANAEHNAYWADTFRSTPPEEVLRAKVNLADTVQRVQDNRLALAARSDLKALKIMEGQQKLKQWQEDAPLRQELLRARIDSTGASQRFQAQKDQETQDDLAQFFGYMKEAPRVGTPEYRSYLNQGISRFPRIISTQAGTDALRNLQREHQDIAAMTPPEGTELHSIDFDEDGRVKANFKPIQPKSDVTVPEGMVPSGATVNKHGDVSVNYSQPKVEDPTKGIDREKALHQSALDRAATRRIAAQKAYDKALVSGNADLIQGNKDLVLAADEDIRAAKSALSELDKKTNSSTESKKEEPKVDFKSADDVRAAFKDGKIPREEAVKILKEKFGHS